MIVKTMRTITKEIKIEQFLIAVIPIFCKGGGTIHQYYRLYNYGWVRCTERYRDFPKDNWQNYIEVNKIENAVSTFLEFMIKYIKKMTRDDNCRIPEIIFAYAQKPLLPDIEQ